MRAAATDCSRAIRTSSLVQVIAVLSHDRARRRGHGRSAQPSIKALGGLRISLADEIAGIDVTEHGERAYHGGDLDELAGGLGDSIVLAHAEDHLAPRRDAP